MLGTWSQKEWQVKIDAYVAKYAQTWEKAIKNAARDGFDLADLYHVIDLVSCNVSEDLVDQEAFDMLIASVEGFLEEYN